MEDVDNGRSIVNLVENVIRPANHMADAGILCALVNGANPGKRSQGLGVSQIIIENLTGASGISYGQIRDKGFQIVQCLIGPMLFRTPLAHHLSHSILGNHAPSRHVLLSTPNRGKDFDFLLDALKGSVLRKLAHGFQHNLLGAHVLCLSSFDLSGNPWNTEEKEKDEG